MMKIVIDTNVVISGVFFGGMPGKIIEAVVRRKLGAFASAEIIQEYEEIVVEMIERKQGHIRRDILLPFIAELELIDPTSMIDICRDPDDNKFLACAKDAKALYIVSGDKDLLDVQEFEGIKIMTAKDFCEQYGL